MSISTILYTGQRALATQQASIQISGQNIANVNTPGYSRQRADLVALQTAFNDRLLSGGVEVEQVTRAYDRFVTAQVNTANSRFHSALEQSDLLGQIESLFNDLNVQDGSLSHALDEFFNGFQDLANEPENMPVRTVVLQRGEIVANAMQRHDHHLKEFRQTLDDTLSQELNQVNTLVSQIADLNQHMRQGAGTPTIQTNTLRDERDQLIKQLSEKMGISTIETEEGSLTVLLQGGRPLVEGAHVNHLVMQDHPDDPMQSLVYMQDDEGNQTNVTSLLTNGKLHGLLDIKDSFIPQVLGGLDRLAAHLTSRVNQQHSAGFGLDGTTGHDFFTPRQASGQGLASNTGGGELQSVAILDPTQLPLDDLRIRFVSDGPPPQLDIVNDATGEVVASGQTYVSGAPLVFAGIEVVLSDSGGLPQSGDTFVIHTTAGSAQRLKVNPALQNDARQIAAAQTGSPGDNANARALANLEDQPLLDGLTMGDFYSALLTGVGATGQLTTGLAEQQQLLLTEVENRRESISGVSLEEEQIDLIRFQQAFAAAAQLINMADELAQTVLNMAG